MNNTIFFYLYSFAHQSIFLDKVIVFFADTFPYIVVLSVFIFLLIHHEVIKSKNPFKTFVQKWREIGISFFSGAFAWLVADILKNLFHTARPFLALSNVSNLIPETGYAFPSGHATFFMALAFSIFFSHKKAGYIFICFALIIGIARVMAGIHFPVDILFGYILGYFVALIFSLIFKAKFIDRLLAIFTKTL